jgi:predicted site-specific integrase-resolvase
MALKNTQEAATDLRVSAGTLHNWRVSGKGPTFVRIGGKVYYRDQDLQAFIEKGVRNSTSETEAA